MGCRLCRVLHDIAEISHGSELRFGTNIRSAAAAVAAAAAMVGFRDANLNNYYYGVQPDEATPLRPAYSARGGAMTQVGLYGAYR